MMVTAAEIRRRAADGLNRAAAVGSIDPDARTVEVAFASDAPVSRWFGDEVLIISPEAMRLERLQDGAAVLVNHDWESQVGVVESVSIAAGRARAVLRFGNSAAARELFQDIADGIRRHVSVGYQVHGIQVEKREGAPDLVKVTDWEPFEISIVSVPADPTVGVGRDARAKGATMPQTNAAPQGASQDNLEDRVAAVLEMGRSYNEDALAAEVLREGGGPAEMTRRILARMDAREGRPLPDFIGLSEREASGFSLMALIRHLAAPTAESAEAAAFELECSRAFARRTGREPQGAFVPPDILMARNFGGALNTQNTAQGGALVATELLSGSFIDVLRNRLSIMQAGATMLDGLVGNVAIPRLAGGATAEWLAEGGSTTNSGLTTDVVLMTPKTVAAAVPITRRLLLQSTPAVETMVRNDLVAGIALAIDSAALNGHASPHAPIGLRATLAGTALNWATAGKPTFAEMVELETRVAAANADQGALRYIYGASMSGHLKSTVVEAGAPVFIEAGEMVNGYPRIKSNQAGAGDAFFGNWSDLLVGMWSGLDLRPDTWTLAASDGLVLRAFQDVDIAVRHPESFALGKTAAPG